MEERVSGEDLAIVHTNIRYESVGTNPVAPWIVC